MRRFSLIATYLLLVFTPAAAQQIDAGAYAFPMLNVARLYSANFGEIRPRHFHVGVDIKTDGVEGKPVVAVADGYISRIMVTPSGYGRALYITLHNGTTAVYGHLQRYRDDIEQAVREERYRRRSNNADLHFDASRFPVRQGDVVAYSGNSGSSRGAHLHYELRDTPTQRYLNLVREGVIRPKDTVAPRILRIHYIEVDTVDGVCLHSPPVPYPVIRGADGKYRLTRSEPIPVGTRGYFVAEVTDRRNGVENSFGVGRIAAAIDGETYFEFRIGDMTPDMMRCSDAVSYYPLQSGSRNETIRLARSAGAHAGFYPVMCERGLVRASAAEERRLHIEAEDDCGNRSTLEFTVRGTGIPYHAPVDSTAVALFADRNATLNPDPRFHIRIPAGALFEPLYTRYTREEAPVTGSGITVLSPVYRIFDGPTPLHKAVGVTIRAEIPRKLQLRASLAAVGNRGSLAFVGGTYHDGGVTAQTRTGTGWVVVADTQPPRITPRFKTGADLRHATSLRFRVADNFSGIASCSLTIDGGWVPCDRLPVQGLLFHLFDTPAKGTVHTAVLVVTDASGNSSRWEGTFFR